MRIALDTNILVYAEGANGELGADKAVKLVQNLPDSSTFLPVQVLGELFHVLVRKAGLSPREARTVVSRWQNTYPLIETSPSVLASAMDLAVDNRLNLWDAVVLAAASEAGCRLLLSEDLQDGFTAGGVTVANPLAAKRHKLLAAALAE